MLNLFGSKFSGDTLDEKTFKTDLPIAEKDYKFDMDNFFAFHDIDGNKVVDMNEAYAVRL